MQKAHSLRQLPANFDLDLIKDGTTAPSRVYEPLRELAYRKAQRDKVWFLENFWQVEDPNVMKFVPFKLRDYQLDDMQKWINPSFNEDRWRGIHGKARQIGATTLVAASAFHDLYFRDNHRWLVASKTQPDAQATLLTRLKAPYRLLPNWFQERGPQLDNDNMESMEFTNGSHVVSVVSTPGVGRGGVVFGVIMDEAAHQTYPHEVFSALDPLCYGPLYVLSTGNGMGNFFHEKWVDSELMDSEWHQRFHPWDVVPGRDQAWYDREKRKYRGREWEFYQEYPSSKEEMFAKTGLAVLPMDLLRDEMEWAPPVQRIDLDMHWQSLASPEGPIYMAEEEDDYANQLWVWEPPTVERDERGVAVRPPNYVVFADIAEGLAHGDRSSVVVMNANTLEQSASYRGWWPIEDMGELLNLIGRWYHTALLLPERNNQGITVINDLRKTWNYPRMYRMASLAAIPSGDRTPRYGWITTPATKPKMVFDFIKGLRDGSFVLHDQRLLEEAATFIRTEKGGFAASNQNYDDHVIGHLGAWQGCLEVGQYPIVWKDYARKPVTWGDMIADMHDKSPDPIAALIGQKEKRPPGFSFILDPVDKQAST